MLNPKQRAGLRALANPIDTILQIGKGGIGEALKIQVDDALTDRELIKLRVLPICELSAKDAAEELSWSLNAEVVQVIGTKLILYRNNPKKNLIKI
ncbi:MAG: YhbY family RNA-binding protein [Oscillospiraceae bacterium]|jgi:RNA-binding protein|nr:YhbY family RNA-binding protein [Oscillospiraceae bacterium]